MTTYIGIFFIAYGIYMLCFAIGVEIINFVEAKKKKAEKEEDYQMDWEAFANDIRKWKEA